jgi:putative nucleotidyltransferase with HDIG domain
MSHARGQAFLEELPKLSANLPYSPALLGTLFAQTGDNSLAPLSDIAATIAQDQGLTARILALANSAYYGLQAQVSSPARALTVLGLAEVRTLVLAVGVASLAKGRLRPGLLDLPAYWRHQVLAASAARILARALGLDPDTLYTAGMLHDLGKLLTARSRPGDWSAITRAARELDLPCHEAEDAHWGVDHALVGAMTLSSWNLPPSLTEPVSWHHAPDRSPDHPRQAAALCLADALAHALEEAQEEAREDAPAAPEPGAAPAPPPAPGPSPLTGVDWRALAASLGLDPDQVLAQARDAAQDPSLSDLLARLAA